MGFVLAAIDQVTHRLPDRIVLPLLGTSFGYMLWLVGRGLDTDRLAQAGSAMAATVLLLWLMAEFPGQPLGFGDVKLGALLALHLGWHSPQWVVLALVVAFVSSGLWVAGRWLCGHLGPSDEVAFGPWLIGGFITALVFIASNA